jgi:HPt (histidine-containing phosphotransfer) domain-containing protein
MLDLTGIPVLNKITINSIISQANGNEKLIHEIFESFVYDVQNMINQIDIAVKNNDFKQFKLIIHTMKGLSATIGASQLHLIAKELDLFLKNEKYEEAISYIPSLIQIYDECKKQVKEEFKIA